MTLNSATKIPGQNTHALYLARKMRNSWATATTRTIYTLGKEFVSKKRKEVFAFTSHDNRLNSPLLIPWKRWISWSNEYDTSEHWCYTSAL